MADEDHNNEQLLTAEFKDGKLEIVEVSSYDKELKEEHAASISSGSSEFMQVLDGDKNNMVVDLLNFTLVRGENGENTYKLVGHGEADSGEADATVTCVLSNDGDGEEHETEEYVMVEGLDGPLVLLQSSLQQTHQAERPTAKVNQKTKPLTPTEILEKVKAYQKAKALMASQTKKALAKPVKPSKPRKAALPTPQEMLSSPNFKLFLYSCKLCSFKCNAIKQLTQHKAIEHFGAAGGRHRGGRAAASTLQCARCPFRASTHTQLVKHAQENHVETVPARIYLDTAEVEAADVLVCGACGFESSSRDVFKRHIQEEHGATTC